MKELLKITLIDEDLYEVKSEVDSYKDGEHLAKALSGALARGGTAFRSAVISAVFAFLNNTRVLENNIKAPVTISKHKS